MHSLCVHLNYFLELAKLGYGKENPIRGYVYWMEYERTLWGYENILIWVLVMQGYPSSKRIKLYTQNMCILSKFTSVKFLNGTTNVGLLFLMCQSAL